MKKLTTETYTGPEVKEIKFHNIGAEGIGGIEVYINGEKQYGITMVLIQPGEIKLERLYKDGKPIDKNGNPKE